MAKGVTTVLDAGSAGAHTFPGFRKYVIDVAQTRVRALLNISVVGQSTLSPDNLHGELLNLNYANSGLAVRTIEQHRDVILGIKVRLSRNIAGRERPAALHLAREAAEAVKLPMMVHIGDTHTPLKDLLPVLRRGRHYPLLSWARGWNSRPREGGSVPEVLTAVGRGVHLDVGHRLRSKQTIVMSSDCERPTACSRTAPRMASPAAAAPCGAAARTSFNRSTPNVWRSWSIDSVTPSV